MTLRFPPILRITLAVLSGLGATRTQAAPVRLTLGAALDRVIATDQSIAIADYEVRQAMLDQQRPLTRVLPQIGFGADASWRGDRTKREAGSVAPSGSNSFGEIARESRWSRSRSNSQSLGFNLNQPLLDLTVGPARRQSELSRRITEWQLRERLRLVLFGVTAQYFEVLKQERLVEEGRKTLGLTSEQLRQAEARLQAEEVIESDVLQARVDDERARRAVLESENSLALARTRLAITLNLPPDTSFVLTEPARGKPVVKALDQAVAVARERREDVRIAELTLHRTHAERDEIRARYAPTLDLSVRRDHSLGSSVDRSENWTAGIAFNWNIFDRGQKDLDLRSNRLELDQAGLRIQETLRAVAEDVAAAWYEADRLRFTVDSLEIERTAAEANLRVQQATYQAGLATSLEVQSAIRDVATARINYVSSTYNLEIALRDLENALAVYESRRIDTAMQRLLGPRIQSPDPVSNPQP